jgi:hypothetical protein
MGCRPEEPSLPPAEVPLNRTEPPCFSAWAAGFTDCADEGNAHLHFVFVCYGGNCSAIDAMEIELRRCANGEVVGTHHVDEPWLVVSVANVALEPDGCFESWGRITGAGGPEDWVLLGREWAVSGDTLTIAWTGTYTADCTLVP